MKKTHSRCKRIMSHTKPCPNKDKKEIKKILPLYSTGAGVYQLTNEEREDADKVCSACESFEPI